MFSIDKIKKEEKEWAEVFSKAKESYEDFIKQDGDKSEIENLRKKKLVLINDAKEKLSMYKRKADQVRSINEKRNRKLSELEEIYQRYTNDRVDKCKYFEIVSNKRLKIEIKQSSNVDNFKQQLLTLKRGSYFRDDEVEGVCEKITPKIFIHKLMQYHASRGNETTRNRITDEVSATTALSQLKAKELFDFLLTSKNLIGLIKDAIYRHTSGST